MRPKARWLVQNGGLPGWMEESDPAGVILYVMDGGRTAYLFRTVFSCFYILNVGKQPSIMIYLTKGRKGLVPMPSLWGTMRILLVHHSLQKKVS